MSHVLIIDDHAGTRELMVAVLETEGHTTMQAADALIAAQLLEREPFDLAIVDIRMPLIDGLEMIQRLRHDYSAMKVIAISGGGSTTTDVLVDALKLGAHLALPKPILPKTLSRAVEQVLAQR